MTFATTCSQNGIIETVLSIFRARLFQLITVGGAKTGEHKQNLACVTRGQSGARTHTRHGGEMIQVKQRSATGTAKVISVRSKL